MTITGIHSDSPIRWMQPRTCLIPWFHLILKATLWERYYYHLSFPDEKLRLTANRKCNGLWAPWNRWSMCVASVPSLSHLLPRTDIINYIVHAVPLSVQLWIPLNKTLWEATHNWSGFAQEMNLFATLELGCWLTGGKTQVLLITSSVLRAEEGRK